ncbi:hypothetical protein SMICM17S_11939 [Streptomyces microflavus]
MGQAGEEGARSAISSRPVSSTYSTGGECRHSSTFGLARSASSQKRSSSHENCSGPGPSICAGGLSKRQNSGVGATYTPRRSVSLPSVARPNAREPMTHA